MGKNKSVYLLCLENGELKLKPHPKIIPKLDLNLKLNIKKEIKKK